MKGELGVIVTQQDSLAKLLLTSKTGVPRDVHVVVKNTPFNVTLGLANNQPRNSSERIDLSRCTIHADVHYDSDDPFEGQQVYLLNSKPCEYKVHLSDKRFDEAVLEIRMKVLTSQHEDMLFRLHVSVIDETHRKTLKTTTAAIKVVSKPDQVRRINGEKGKKRTNADAVNDTLERVEKRQKQQQAFLLRILSLQQQQVHGSNPHQPINGNELPPLSGSLTNSLTGSLGLGLAPLFPADSSIKPMGAVPSSAAAASQQPPLSFLPTASPAPPQQPSAAPSAPNGASNATTQVPIVFKPQMNPESKDQSSFEDVFSLCLKRFASLPPGERPGKIRKVMNTTCVRDSRAICEFADLLHVEGKHHQRTEVAPTQQIYQPIQQHLQLNSVIVPPTLQQSFPAVKREPVHATHLATHATHATHATQPQQHHVPASGDPAAVNSSLTFSEPLSQEFMNDMLECLNPYHF